MPILIQSQREAHGSEEVNLDRVRVATTTTTCTPRSFLHYHQHICDSVALEIYSIVFRKAKTSCQGISAFFSVGVYLFIYCVEFFMKVVIRENSNPYVQENNRNVKCES